MSATADDILVFWLGEVGERNAPSKERSKVWFDGGTDIDTAIAERFSAVHAQAAAGAFDVWASTPAGRLALTIVLDQFSRNLYRASPLAFACDARALALSMEALERGEDRALLPTERAFITMPMMHSEELSVQERGVEAFAQLAKDVPEAHRESFSSFHRFAVRHRDIIARFGRFPHRNKVLGRSSTVEEIEHMKSSPFL